MHVRVPGTAEPAATVALVSMNVQETVGFGFQTFAKVSARPRFGPARPPPSAPKST